MSAALTLAKPEHIDKLEALVASYHDAADLRSDEASRRAALAPLLAGSPHGAVYLIGPPRAPIGYIALSFGWSLIHGGLTGCIEEMFVRTGVRGRGIATEVLGSLPKALAGAGLRALTVRSSADLAKGLFRRAGFTTHEGDVSLSRDL